jgi:hypothetical protein
MRQNNKDSNSSNKPQMTRMKTFVLVVVVISEAAEKVVEAKEDVTHQIEEAYS